MSGVAPAEEHRELVARLFPQMALASFEPVGGGWDCFTYEADGEWIVQLPRVPRAVESLRAQMRMLPELVGEVSAPVPSPDLMSFDPPAMGYRKIDGVALEAGELPQSGMLPERLGRFLYDLHMVPLEYLGLRSNGHVARRARCVLELSGFRDRVFPLLSEDERSRAHVMFDGFMGDERHFRFPDVLVHRDLGPEHILMGVKGDLAGVIDWGDAAPGDPAIDFAWSLHRAPEIGERALAAYGGAPDPTFRDRAKFYDALGPWHEVAYGLDAGRPERVASGLTGVRARLR